MGATTKKQKAKPLKINSRKEKRKHERLEKKKGKMLFFSRKFGHVDKDVLTPAPVSVPEIKMKEQPKKRKRKEKSPASIRKKQLLRANADEDKSIKRLEKILKLNKRKTKNIPKAFAADGLDYILELIDRPDDSGMAEFNLNIGDKEIEDDLNKAIGKDEIMEEASDSNSDQENSDLDSDEGHGSNFFVDGNQPVKLASQKDVLQSKVSSLPIEINEMKALEVKVGTEELKKVSKSLNKELKLKAKVIKIDKETSDQSSKQQNKGKKTVHWQDKEHDNETSDNDSSDSDNSDLPSESEEVQENSDTENTSSKKKKSLYWEDIYGRLRDKEGNVVSKNEDLPSATGKYVPPAKRVIAGSEDSKKREIQSRIQKQMRGLLNKLNEQNMKHVTDQIESLYMQNSRNDMNESLILLVQQSVVLPYFTPEKLVMEHALLIALLHCNIGSEVGAHCLQSLATILNSKLKQRGSDEEGKEVDNLLLLLCHLYTFRITHSLLIYDILKSLVESFQSKDVELILLILRSVGFLLRKDDPLELKNVIISLQNQVAKFSHLADQSRIRFMLETIMAIRNNNMHKIPNYDPSLAEHLRKVLKALQRKGTYIQELHISLDDLLKAEERGRWWIVGSAWQGVGTEEVTESTANTNSPVITEKFSKEVLDLARKQRMNTEVRKNIFCVLMSAEDYMDAFEKLLKLGLKNQQDRECIHVSLDCCIQEKQYNPYYGFLIEKFCSFDRKYQLALQYALWDKFKDLNNMKSTQVTNLAHLLVHLFIKSALPLSVLKTIQLAEMDKVLVKFLRQIMLAILLHESEDLCRNVFLRIAPSPKLHSMREGLRLFMLHFLLRNQSQLESNVAVQLKDRVDLAIRTMNSIDHKGQM